MLEELSNDFSKYLKVDLNTEVKTDSEHSSSAAFPIVQFKQKLNFFFNQVDSVEKFVNHVKSELEIIAVQVEEAEEELGQSNGKFKNMLKPLFSKMSTSDASVRRPNKSYEAPILFQTSTFFPPQSKSLVEDEKKPV
ncbi:conserved hypothetical protein [Pediculus humanus corporis]|uniref:Uncharacterized protein n=1 Tax=Pediculus humanus subsp. corporis TaxID=121224 RepID=E0W0P4_PEDHC|nr:uncharacterized protein Phum_PHUM561160 [Pediculus humanus corporis]EEB19200.1 conserved hypothetical protein [Pediculus humanus corporis]